MFTLSAYHNLKCAYLEDYWSKLVQTAEFDIVQDTFFFLHLIFTVAQKGQQYTKAKTQQQKGTTEVMQKRKLY